MRLGLPQGTVWGVEGGLLYQNGKAYRGSLRLRPIAYQRCGGLWGVTIIFFVAATRTRASSTTRPAKGAGLPADATDANV